jgi:hypothetical protein
MHAVAPSARDHDVAPAPDTPIEDDIGPSCDCVDSRVACDFLERAGGHRADGERDAVPRGRARGQDLGARADHAEQPGRGDHQGKRQRVSEQTCRQVAGRDVGEDSRHQRVLREAADIPADRHFVARPAFDVIEDEARQAALCCQPQVVDVYDHAAWHASDEPRQVAGNPARRTMTRCYRSITCIVRAQRYRARMKPSKPRLLLSSVFKPFTRDDEFGSRDQSAGAVSQSGHPGAGAVLPAHASPVVGTHDDPAEPVGPLDAARLPDARPVRRGAADRALRRRWHLGDRGERRQGARDVPAGPAALPADRRSSSAGT